MKNWRPVVGFEDYYQVSDEGDVVSTRNNHGNPRWRPVKPGVTWDGYLRCGLSKSGVKSKKHVAHMVLEAFVGPRPEGMLACHNDDNGLNAKLSNLRWGTPRSNYDDTIRLNSRKGEKHGCCTITEDIARQIKLVASDRTILARDIAIKFGTTVNVVRNIRNGASWSWV